MTAKTFLIYEFFFSIFFYRTWDVLERQWSLDVVIFLAWAKHDLRTLDPSSTEMIIVPLRKLSSVESATTVKSMWFAVPKSSSDHSMLPTYGTNLWKIPRISAIVLTGCEPIVLEWLSGNGFELMNVPLDRCEVISLNLWLWWSWMTMFGKLSWLETPLWSVLPSSHF